MEQIGLTGDGAAKLPPPTTRTAHQAEEAAWKM